MHFFQNVVDAGVPRANFFPASNQGCITVKSVDAYVCTSSETQGQSVGSGEGARREFSSTGERVPGYRLSSNYFQKFKRSRLLIGHKKCCVLFCPISEPFVLSSFIEFVHDGYCPVRSPSLCEQGKLLFSTFLTRNSEGTTDESKKRLGCY